ncbi:MAG: hypothetical protein D6704_04955 [Nitrospirae bacterium]|nr:MAG: hypothetical protein D6704_04955 [Nitrospirota bacterium]
MIGEGLRKNRVTPPATSRELVFITALWYKTSIRFGPGDEIDERGGPSLMSFCLGVIGSPTTVLST